MKRITVELDANLVELLEEVAEESGATLADIIAEAAGEYLQAAGYYLPTD